jgi:hypothetical protein
MSEIRLSKKEAKVLDLLERSPGRVVTRKFLLETVWGYNEGVKTRTLDVHISRLSSKLTANLGIRIQRHLWAGLPPGALRPANRSRSRGRLPQRTERGGGVRPPMNHSNSCWIRAT